MKNKKNQTGFTYIETIISLVIVTIGLLGAISALTWGFFYMQNAEKKTKSKEFANSVIESIFAVRDITSQEVTPTNTIAISGWDLVQTKTASNTGIFADGWFPVRVTPGDDGIVGTTDDSCAAGNACNNNAEVSGYLRKIEITDIVEDGIVRKRRIVVSVSYSVGSINRVESISTIIANLPFK